MHKHKPLTSLSFLQIGTRKINFVITFCARVCLSGVFLWRLGVGAGDRGHPVAEGGWEEVVEETLLPPQSFGDLLRPQRQRQGQ